LHFSQDGFFISFYWIVFFWCFLGNILLDINDQKKIYLFRILKKLLCWPLFFFKKEILEKLIGKN